MNLFFLKEIQKSGRPRNNSAKVLRGERHRTPREDEVLVYIGKGLGNKQIADKMGIKVETVKNYVTALFHQFNTQSRVQLVVKALKSGDLNLEEL